MMRFVGRPLTEEDFARPNGYPNAPMFGRESQKKSRHYDEIMQ